MEQQLKIMTIVGTRPEIIRLSCVIKKLEESNAINHILVHTGQNFDYELNEVFFEDLNLKKPNYYLNAAGKNPSETIGKIFISIEPILAKEDPDAILILGDTNSALCAIPAKKRKIPIFHMEAGNRCFDKRVPEETNRVVVDHISDINLTYSSIAREYLLREGLQADRIIKTGSPMFEVINSKIKKINSSNILKKLKVQKKKYFVVSSHREENIDSEKNFTNLLESLNSVAEKYKLPIIVSTHPRTKNKLDEKKLKYHSLIKFIKPLGFIDYVKLQKESKAVLSDSGTISEESSILKFPALNIREAHERPEAMEEGSVMMVGLEKNRIFQGLDILSNQKEDDLRMVNDYSMPNVSEKVIRIILSYTDYINRNVWFKVK
ncbi:MAG: UDP-N-acetylglucosamine 2-epimerase (non-hydrolyzing) [Flavobacteriaceae bacterium]|nr:UDP-N-acetylglucosamine 2-epimerase (non-hydrolyzing) [Flavobacteriaceae bacterium]|tara:strand:- start:21375 stop:22508 length:1134 start_codon:yes stop_codon:yes gene_type:complete